MNVILLLSIIIPLAAFCIVLVLLLTRKTRPRIYKPKGPYLLSAGEKRFFDALTNSVPPYLYICPKVRLSDVIEVDIPKNDPNFWRHLAPINQKHVDFVLVNKTDFAPRLAIELDGGSHQDRQRANRDAFINSVFQSAGIPMLHIPVKGFYQYAELRRDIEQSLVNKSPEQK